MCTAYEEFSKLLESRLTRLRSLRNDQSSQLKCSLLSLPPHVLRGLWIPRIKQMGFYDGVGVISDVIGSFIETLERQLQSKLYKFQQVIMRQIIPEMVVFGLNAVIPQQIIGRISKLKDQWKLDMRICGHYIAWFELSLGGEDKQTELKIQKILGQMLAMFGCTQSKVDYWYWCWQTLQTAVGEILYEMRMNILDWEDVYQNFIYTNKKTMNYLLDKLKTRPITFAAIFSELTLLENNCTTESKLMNVSRLFLVVEYWQRLKPDSQLKQNTIVYIISEAFQRIMYMLYSCEDKLCGVFLFMLAQSNFNRFEEISLKVGYHLIALYKVYRNAEKDELAKTVQSIWRDKMQQVKINEMYLSQCPPFVSSSQKLVRSNLEDCETKSFSVSSVSIKGTQSKSRKSQSRTNNLYIWIKTIEAELKKFNVQRVYLLLSGIKKFYSSEYQKVQQRPNKLILWLIVTIVKKIQQKLLYRYNCKILSCAIKWQISHLINLCYSKQFTYEQQMVGLGLFELCSAEGGYMNLEELVQLHEKFNFQETLETVMNLKCLEQEISNNAISNKLQTFEEILKDESFESRLYQLFRVNFFESKQDKKKLIVIAHLLSLKSNNITNNLLVNYVYYLLQRQKYTEAQLQTKTIALSIFMNQEIVHGSDWQRIKLFLKMSTVFDDFDRKRKQKPGTTTTSVSEKYFHFLMRQDHQQHFLLYSQRYQKLNYLKEAIFFLELHCSVHNEQSLALKKKAMDLYSRINGTFSNNIAFIAKYQKMELEQQKNIWANEVYQLQHVIEKGLKNISLYFVNKDSPIFIQGLPVFTYWMKYYQHIISFYIDRICEFKESNEIRQNLFICNILVNILNIKLAQHSQSKQIKFSLLDLIHKIQHLKNQRIQLIFYRILMEDLQIMKIEEKVQQYYLQKLLKSNKSEQLMSYLKQRQNMPNYDKKYMRYIIKDNFQNNRFIEAMAFIREYLQFKDIQNRSEIYQLELECKYSVLLNFTLAEYLDFLNKKCITPLQSKDNKEKHFSFYFKIFRMLFQRYSFTKQSHNDIFLEAYYKFIETSRICSQHKQYIPQAIFYLLRFVLEQFCYGQSSRTYGLTILQYFRGFSKEFVPYCTYLLKRISGNHEKNGIIETILIHVITQNSKDCIWIISFLKNFQIMSSKTKSPDLEDEQEAKVIRSIYRKIVEELQSKKILTKFHSGHLSYLETLTKFALMETNQKRGAVDTFKKLQVPAQLPFVFLQDYYIYRIQDVKVLSNGKSAPLQLALMLKNSKSQDFKYVRIIIKAISSKNYRMQSNTANFFSEIGLIDKDVTYHIFHLSKNVVLIEHVQNSGTINSLIQTYFPHLRQIQERVMSQLNKLKQKGRQQKRALQLYDELKGQTRARVSEIIISKCRNMSQWWLKFNNFIRTHAQWSFIGYIVGLGDRHFDNILMAENCKLIHIDFQYALDIGYKLPYPQWTPFRLTNCLIQPLGVLGVFGLYYAQMIKVGRQFESRESNIWKAISNFVDYSESNLTQEIMNRSKFVNYRINCLEDGMAHIINCAQKQELLRLMYKGWRPYY